MKNQKYDDIRIMHRIVKKKNYILHFAVLCTISLLLAMMSGVFGLFIYLITHTALYSWFVAMLFFSLLLFNLPLNFFSIDQFEYETVEHIVIGDKK